MDTVQEIRKIQKSLDKLQSDTRQLKKTNRVYKRTSKLIVAMQKQYEDHIAKMKEEQINMERILEEKMNEEKMNEEKMNEEKLNEKGTQADTSTTSNYTSPSKVWSLILGFAFLQIFENNYVIDIIVSLLMLFVIYVWYKFRSV
jgi:CRISPR/Cas system CSM-associated protein Csm4 (group 5 of RAMP superfamily)